MHTSILTVKLFFLSKGSKMEDAGTGDFKTGKTADTLLFLYIHICPKGIYVYIEKPHFKTRLV